ncbi:EAL domain-containing protein [Tumebacillus permanentifrigoris]|uniref:PAS domain S-box-containing protein/diguanylate cyclase (GGDEF)-like protein n=1 Tax=Tumebacillus permanentifrigoris TaxID=378543 RepID=A0A316D7U9_9BACL|nr:EAL domain-containing protein [Tumebacillus permanentifrigoris]PWK10345.1 PAS domain S-box-containing protein/diguanylate cyclase (GGDEF)-like protein [Tumebacillus permanentifrigoris]
MIEMLGTYNWSLMLLSVLVAVFASYTVCDLTQRIRQTTRRAVNRWVVGGAVAMGTGIWAMHFLAILALQLDEAITYDLDLMVLALASGILFSYLSLYLYSRHSGSRRTLLLVSACLTLTNLALHSIAILGMGLLTDSSAHLGYLLTSSLLGMIAIYFALRMLNFRCTKHPGRRSVYSALLLGTALSGIHVSALLGMDFRPDPHAQSELDLIHGEWLAIMIGMVTMIIQIVLMWSLHDERHTASQQAVRSTRQFDSLYNNNPDLVVSLTPLGEVISLNPAGCQMMGYSPEEVVGHHFAEYVLERDQEKTFYHFGLALSGNPQHAVEVSVRHRDGQYREMQVTTIPILTEAGQLDDGLYVIAKDVTDRLSAERTILHMAYHDALTDLPNRRLFIEELETSMATAAEKGEQIAILFLDLDRFKRINDSLGHNVGDLLLQHISTRLQEALAGIGLAGRFGGDEFIVLLRGVNGSEEVSLLTGSLYEIICQPLETEEQEFKISTSIGIALYPKDGQDAMTLIKNADTAMYRAKEARIHYQFYNDLMNEETAERLALEQDLTRALERDEFVLHYQPKVDIATGNIQGAEALIRWYHPKKGLIPPDKFIPLAEETDMILQIGDWVLRTACEQNKKWHTAGYTDLQIAVNLSAMQFGQTHLVDRVAHVLHQTGLPSEYLELEITERVAMQESVTVIEKLQQLTELGVQISIDDFGTGYSSLSYLVKYPIHAIKMDRSFVSEVIDDSEQALVVKAILSMAHSLGLHVVAEGVEELGQLEFLQTYNCDEYQGYYFSRPLPAPEFEVLLAQHLVR